MQNNGGMFLQRADDMDSMNLRPFVWTARRLKCHYLMNNNA